MHIMIPYLNVLGSGTCYRIRCNVYARMIILSMGIACNPTSFNICCIYTATASFTISHTILTSAVLR